MTERKPKREVPGDVLDVNNYDIGDVGALQALERGDAQPHQQQNALKYIIETLCGTYDLSFRPGGPEAERATTLAEGKRFIGLQLVKLIKINPKTLKEDK